jgi:hypothetical protein
MSENCKIVIVNVGNAPENQFDIYQNTNFIIKKE